MQTSRRSVVGHVSVDFVGASVDLHLLVDPVGGAAQGQFAQGNEIAFAEEVLERRPALLFGRIDLALRPGFQRISDRGAGQ